MTSRRRLKGYNEWIINIKASPQTELVATDAARLAANSGIELQMSVAEPQHPPVFEPHRIRFNSLHHPGEDFEYPPYPNSERTAVGECCTNEHDYDLLVRAMLLSIKHHLADDAFIQHPGSLGDQQWNDAFDLYRRTFPERKIPSLVGWPQEVEQHLEEMEERLRREQELVDANPQPCTIYAAAKARAEGRTPEAPPPVPRPSFLSNDPSQSLLRRLLSREDSQQDTH